MEFENALRRDAENTRGFAFALWLDRLNVPNQEPVSQVIATYATVVIGAVKQSLQEDPKDNLSRPLSVFIPHHSDPKTVPFLGKDGMQIVYAVQIAGEVYHPRLKHAEFISKQGIAAPVIAHARLLIEIFDTSQKDKSADRTKKSKTSTIEEIKRLFSYTEFHRNIKPTPPVKEIVTAYMHMVKEGEISYSPIVDDLVHEAIAAGIEEGQITEAQAEELLNLWGTFIKDF